MLGVVLPYVFIDASRFVRTEVAVQTRSSSANIALRRIVAVERAILSSLLCSPGSTVRGRLRLGDLEIAQVAPPPVKTFFFWPSHSAFRAA